MKTMTINEPTDIRDVLHDPRYMWVAIDTLYNSPTMIFKTVEKAVECTIGSDRYMLKPVRVYDEKEYKR